MASTTEELEAQILAEMEANPEAYADTGIEYCTVDDDTRLVTVPDKYKKLGVESDEKAKRVWFRFPKLVGNNGVDLSAIGVRVNFRNANGDGDIYIVEDLTTDGDYVTFSWELTRKVTAYKGHVSFVVCAVKSATDGTIKNEWNTTLNKECEVLEGLEVTEQIAQENPDIIEYILANLGGSVSAEQIATAVEEYMAKNPQKDVSYEPQELTEEQKAQARKNIGAEASGTAESKVSEHNASDTAHNDIRLLVQGLTERLNALADSDDTTLDQMSEVVAYIKSNKSLIDAITTSKVSVSDIVDNLTTNVSNKPLSAAQGVALKAMIDEIAVPEKLPNPYPLTFTGGASGSYDGSESVTITIPQGDGSSISITEETLEGHYLDLWERSVSGLFIVKSGDGEDIIVRAAKSDSSTELGYVITEVATLSPQILCDMKYVERKSVVAGTITVTLYHLYFYDAMTGIYVHQTDKMKGSNPSTFETKAPITDGSIFIQSPDTAEIGQVLEVETVDENGNPTSWKTVTIQFPDKLPNPQKLTFDGAVTAEYDGSGAVTVTIPEGGGTGVTVDNTLSVSGKAADAKATGDAISSLSEDLGGYVTKETGNANQITFADGQTFQTKLDAGILKGEKGDKGDKGDTGATGAKGDKGEDGLTTNIVVNGTTYTHSNGTITLPNYPTVVSTADGITIADTAGNFTATNVEGALAELFQFVSNGKTLIASAITDMGVDTSNTDSFEIMANKIRTIIGEQPLYTFGLLSDVHVDGDGTDEAHSISDLTNAISFLQNAGANFIAYCGDMTYNGNDYDYTALKTCLNASTIPNYCVRGNHDAYSLSDGYASATGCEDDYIITQGNDLLIFISCADANHDTGGLTTSKLDWLENLLQTNTNTRVFLFYHYFVDGTSGNGTGVYPYGTLNPSNEIALRFINMVKQYSNLIYCSGHSHMRFNIQEQDANANYYHNDGECYYIHIPSGAKPRYPDSSNSNGVTDYNAGSEGYLVEVYANKVLFKPIDFISSEYLTKYNYTANVAQGANKPTLPTKPTEPTEPSTPTITWNDGIKIDKSTGAETSDTRYSASDFIACDTSKTYTLNLASAMPTRGANVFACYYDESQSFISCSSNFIGSYNSSSEVLTADLSLPTNAKYIKLRLFAVNDASTMDKSIITLTATNPTSSSEVIATTWSTGNITSSGVENDSDTSAMRSSSIEFDTNYYEYYITVSSEYEGIQNIKVYFYNSDGTFNSRATYTSTSLTVGVPGAIEFPITTGTFRIKTDFGTTNTLENISDRLIVTKVPK